MLIKGIMMITNRPQLVLSISLLLLAAAAAFAQAQAPPPPPPIYHVYWDTRTETFDDLRSKLRHQVIANSAPYNPPSISQIVVLGPRRADHYDAPPAWIHIHVKFGDGPEEQVTLAMAIDDLCIIGFSNGAGEWFQFSGGLANYFKGMPAGTRVLPIEQNYGDLITGGHAALWQVPLGRSSATHAARELAAYQYQITPDPQLKDGCVRFVAMIGEGMRLREIRETFSGPNWDKETFMTQDHANSVVGWGSSSKLLIRWYLTSGLPGGPKWGGGPYTDVAEKVRKSSKIFGAADALNNKFDFLLQPQDSYAELIS